MHHSVINLHPSHNHLLNLEVISWLSLDDDDVPLVFSYVYFFSTLLE